MCNQGQQQQQQPSRAFPLLKSVQLHEGCCAARTDKLAGVPVSSFAWSRSLKQEAHLHLALETGLEKVPDARDVAHVPVAHKVVVNTHPTATDRASGQPTRDLAQALDLDRSTATGSAKGGTAWTVAGPRGCDEECEAAQWSLCGFGHARLLAAEPFGLLRPLESASQRLGAELRITSARAIVRKPARCGCFFLDLVHGLGCCKLTATRRRWGR